MKSLETYADYLVQKAKLIKNRIALTDSEKLSNINKANTYLEIAEDMYRITLNKQGQQPQVK